MKLIVKAWMWLTTREDETPYGTDTADPPTAERQAADPPAAEWQARQW